MGESNMGRGKRPRLLDRVRLAIRVRHLSRRTETAYVGWIRRYIVFHDRRHPKDLDATAIERFLTHLAVERGLSPSTQNQARAAVLFLYRHVLRRDPGEVERVVHARRRRRIPVVLTREEVRAVMRQLDGTPHLENREMYARWETVLHREYQQLIQAAKNGRSSLIDPYGTTNIAEFFAVSVECFFEQAELMKHRHPEWFSLLEDFFKIPQTEASL